MVSAFTRLAALLGALSFIHTTVSVPLQGPQFDTLDVGTRNILARSTPAAPRFVVYSDAWVSGETGPPAVADVAGWNVFALSFLLASGSADQATEWESITADQRASYISQYHAAGISLIVSAFGSTETPASSGYDPTDTANTMAAWVKEYDLDGIDVDFEDFSAFDAGTGEAEDWLITFTTVLREALPSGSYIITHAPVAPWFSPSIWGGGGYLYVNEKVGDLIDWYNIQFYNQGVTEYTTCSGLFTESSSTWPESAVFQIAASGVELSKIVVGKPAAAADATNGYMDPSTLAGCVASAVADGWTGGIMSWEYPSADAAWIATVRGSTWPESGSTTTPTSTKTTTTSTKTTTSPATTTTSSSSGSCSGVSAWSSSTAYSSGAKVTYDGDLWTANQWNEDEVPGGSSGAWNSDGACNGPLNGPASASATATGPVNPPFPFLTDAVAALPASRAAISTVKHSATPSASAAARKFR